jgi:hypothetical protein
MIEDSIINKYVITRWIGGGALLNYYEINMKLPVLRGSADGAGQVMLGGLATLFSGFALRLAHFSCSETAFLTVSAAPADDMMLSIARLSLSPLGPRGRVAKGVPGMINGRTGQPHLFFGVGPRGNSPLMTLMPGQLGPCSFTALVRSAPFPGYRAMVCRRMTPRFPEDDRERWQIILMQKSPMLNFEKFAGNM